MSRPQSPRAVPALGSHLCYWIREASNQVSQSFARLLETHSVTLAEWPLLRQLYDLEPLPPSRLAAELGLTRGTISTLESRVVFKEFVARMPSGTDGRSHTLALTPWGRRMVPWLARHATEIDREFFGHLSPEDWATLQRMLMQVVRLSRLRPAPLD